MAWLRWMERFTTIVNFPVINKKIMPIPIRLTACEFNLFKFPPK